MKPSLSIIITSYNEEDTIEKTVSTTLRALGDAIDDYEIIIIDDTSRDHSFEIAQKLAAKNSHIRAIRNEKNMNQGKCFEKSFNLATKEYHCLLSGDDLLETESLRRLFLATGDADIILNIPLNTEARHPIRKFISFLYVQILNILFGLRIKYYNGPTIIRTSLLKTLKISGAFSFMAEAVIPLLKRGVTYVAIPVKLNPDKKGANVKTLKRNFLPVVRAILGLWWKIQILKKY